MQIVDNDRARRAGGGLRPARWLRGVPVALRLARLRPRAGERTVPRAAGKFAAWDIPLPGDDKRAGLCAARHARGERLSRRHGARRELRDGEPPADQRARARSVPGSHSGREGPARVFHQPQHRAQGIAAGRSRRIPANAGCIAKARRARFPAGHPSLKDTPFAETGHPILLPGNPTRGLVRDGRRRRARRRAATA